MSAMSLAATLNRVTAAMYRFRRSISFVVLACASAGTVGSTIVSRPGSARDAGASGWSQEERAKLRSLTLTSLSPQPRDPSNRYADDPRAAALGRELFFDRRLSGNGKVSCASCHMPDQDFQDGKPLGEGVGTTARRTMPIAGTSRSPWLFWDGRADSQWEQALGPLESAAEHGGSRTEYALVLAEHYRADYEKVFGALPELSGLPRRAGPIADAAARQAWQGIAPARRDDISRVYANIGKAIAAYERKIEFAPSRFDRYVDAELAGTSHTADSELTPDEVAGLRIFIGKGSCTNCHNGALLTDNHFHNTGVPAAKSVAAIDSGRVIGVRQAVAGEFSCTSKFSDAKPDECGELQFAVTEGDELVRAYKTPSLRNVAGRAPYMHAGQYASLTDVVRHYSTAPAAPFGRTELKALRLTAIEQRQLEAFLRTLSSPITAPTAGSSR
jgi:cytochrome c peroxidase